MYVCTMYTHTNAHACPRHVQTRTEIHTNTHVHTYTHTHKQKHKHTHTGSTNWAMAPHSFSDVLPYTQKVSNGKSFMDY